MNNVSDMPQDYWAWLDTGTLVPLGICEGYTEAFDKADALSGNSHWVFSRQGLEEFQQEINRELPAQIDSLKAQLDCVTNAKLALQQDNERSTT